jgi:hypothetical protein
VDRPLTELARVRPLSQICACAEPPGASSGPVRSSRVSTPRAGGLGCPLVFLELAFGGSSLAAGPHVLGSLCWWQGLARCPELLDGVLTYRGCRKRRHRCSWGHFSGGGETKPEGIASRIQLCGPWLSKA